MGTGQIDPIEELADIKAPVAIPTYEWVWWLSLGLVLLAIVIWLWMRHRKKKADYVPPPLTPMEIAMNRLKGLMANNESLSDKEFIVEVSGALRSFIEGSINIPAPDLTTEEFLSRAANHRLLKGERAEKLSGFLQECDMVKFAKQSLPKEHRVDLHASAVNFIKTVR
tara:strand:- start:13 stop:516 length:504 start_codon:yes stop_codon:yes gene_type:complete